VWNTTGDTASIYRTSDLRRIDLCSWGRRGDYIYCRQRLRQHLPLPDPVVHRQQHPRRLPWR
jgi:hypothetical protein